MEYNNQQKIDAAVTLIERLSDVTCRLTSHKDGMPTACSESIKLVITDILKIIAERTKAIKELLNVNE